MIKENFVKLVNCLGSEHEEEESYLRNERRERYMKPLGTFLWWIKGPREANIAQWQVIRRRFLVFPLTFCFQMKRIHKSKLKTSKNKFTWKIPNLG